MVWLEYCLLVELPEVFELPEMLQNLLPTFLAQCRPGLRPHRLSAPRLVLARLLSRNF